MRCKMKNISIFAIAFIILAISNATGGGGGPTLIATPTQLDIGQPTPTKPITVQFFNALGQQDDFVCRYLVGESNNCFGHEYYYLYGATSGTLTFSIPVQEGIHEFRMFSRIGPNGEYQLIATSNPVIVGNPPPIVPEMPTMAMVSLGIFGLLYIGKRRKIFLFFLKTKQETTEIKMGKR